MAKKLAAVSLIFFVWILLGCKKFQKDGYVPQPGIVLTFDDDRVDNWFKYLPLLDSAGVKATFYICKYNKFTAEQKNKLRILRDHGHEIAYHTINHYNMVDYVFKYHHTVEELMRVEIEAGLKQMNADGFYPITFAYPYGAHNGQFDQMLKKYFRSVRALNGSPDYSKSLTATEKNDVLYGMGLDKTSQKTDETIMKIIRGAKENNNCAVFVAHDINSGPLSVTRARLVKIFALVNELGLKYYTAAEISN